jgi:CRP-like cAMP-binding protein
VSSNRILARLSPADFRVLEPNLEGVDLSVRKQLHTRNRRIEHVYFPESGIASIVANGEHALEIGIIGREGMTGVALAMGINERPKHEAYIQVAGKGHRLSADHLREALEASAALRQAILQYAHAFMTQMADTALSNGRQKIEERLARWLTRDQCRQIWRALEWHRAGSSDLGATRQRQRPQGEVVLAGERRAAGYCSPAQGVRFHPH